LKKDDRREGGGIWTERKKIRKNWGGTAIAKKKKGIDGD
jgi:hypothetical protein